MGDEESRRDIERGNDKAYRAEIKTTSYQTFKDYYLEAMDEYISKHGYTEEQDEVVRFIYNYISKKI